MTCVAKALQGTDKLNILVAFLVLQSTESIKSKEKDGAIINLFDGKSPEYQYLISAVAICFLLLCVFGSYAQISKCRRHSNNKKQLQESSGINEESMKV